MEFSNTLLGNFTTWHPFAITGGLVAGQNTLDFYVTNAAVATGLRVELSGSATCCCPPVGTISLNTGYNQNSGTVYDFGAADAFWVVTKDPTGNTTVPRPATVIQPYSPPWMQPLPLSQWITSYPSAVDPLNGEYDFETYFCVATNATNLVLNVCLRADDVAGVYLNGHLITLVPANTTYNTLVPACGEVVAQSWFVYGLQKNVLHVAVTNTANGAMGLNLTGTVTGSGLSSAPCCSPLSGISGQKFYDLNGNGVRDPGEPPLSGWGMHLSTGTTYDAITDANGYYYFQNLPAGIYTVTEVPQPGWTRTAPASGLYTVTLGVAQQINGQDFGNTCTNNNTNCIQIFCPSNIVTACTGSETPVYFTVTANNLCSNNAPTTLYCSPLSGSLFPAGTTTVHCTAYNNNCEFDTCSFTVTVQPR